MEKFQLESREQCRGTQEWILLTKFFQTTGELSKLEHGRPANKAERLQMWKLAMETILAITRPVGMKDGKEQVPIAKSVAFAAVTKTDTPEPPAGAVGLDSWANVWLRYAS